MILRERRVTKDLVPDLERLGTSIGLFEGTYGYFDIDGHRLECPKLREHTDSVTVGPKPEAGSGESWVGSEALRAERQYCQSSFWSSRSTAKPQRSHPVY